MLYRGIPASHGVVVGPALVMKQEPLQAVARIALSPEQIQPETDRFFKAVADVRHDLENIADSVGDVVEGRQILEFLLLLLQDPTIAADVESCIRDEQVNAEYALSRTLSDVVNKFSKMTDPYLRERVADVSDVGRRVLAKLSGRAAPGAVTMQEPSIMVAKDLDPSETAGFDPARILAFATDMGGETSHTSILARSLGIPAVVGLRNLTGNLRTGDTIIVDGLHGYVIVNPTEEEIDYHSKVRDRFLEAEHLLQTQSTGPAVTGDGCRVELAANIELPHEVELVKKVNADGIGLFRTEFIRLISEDATQEEAQFQIYEHVAASLDPEPVIIRTFDMGGDKFRAGFDSVPEANPFLGYRAVRICLDRPAEFSTQLRAIFRASSRGNVRLMFPMVTHVEQLRRLHDLLAAIRNDLDVSGIPYDRSLKVGIMVETPATVSILDLMLPWVDFVSIGTNDLTQYTLAVDRGNPRVAELYDNFHPAVLRQIDKVVRICHEKKKWVGVCGAMAGDPLAVPLLLGFGVDELSVSPPLIPDVKKMIAVVTTHGSREIAEQSLSMETGLAVRAKVHSYVVGKYPEILLNENSWKNGG
ncbi:phosphoenolpyruvate--protein phosphotransferase [Candidatus Fermentibacteria bacterium]|nr:MAG: phosphoenolpyruvate--protein phosphotransferase [Candidatus Fermentibacteria bacterium]PIE52281.1 MAG: phosphoenolpyruvate--protein phosphotransferase [Candidatus Fermentibacteria bacterium]PIE52776.1 MAG: phosphoenolpyruvate--protein phosphotransferase [Candidatus Fermentibacteria bacterium]